MDAKANGYARVLTAQPHGIDATLVTVEADLSRGLHSFSIIGLADKAVAEARDRLSSAIKNAGFKSPKATNRRIVLSLAPASLRKEGSQYDLPLAVAYLIAVGEMAAPAEPLLFCGELGLDGSIHPIRGMLAHALCAKREGISSICVPYENAQEALLVEGIRVYPARHLNEVIAHMRGIAIPPAEREPIQPLAYAGPDFAEIRGQESAKRALVIAAAGRHNLMLHGPPGSGKTMLARSLPSILPPLSEADMLTATVIHSSAGELAPGAVLQVPPFRTPHHTASTASMIGGGPNVRPGEITLAHTGVLFMDEFIEFDVRTLEALRQPLEDKMISISRTKGSMAFPADFMLVAAMNPAGTLAEDDAVIRLKTQRQAQKLSQPIIERIDLWVEVPRVSGIEKEKAGADSSTMREQVRKARACMIKGELPCSAEAGRILRAAMEKFVLSLRSHARILRVARTIANLSDAGEVEAMHIMEALQYRPRGFGS